MLDQTRHHPETAIFYRFIAGDLPMGMNLAISAHIARCESCQRRAAASQEAQSNAWYAQQSSNWNKEADAQNAPQFDDVLEAILETSPTAGSTSTIKPAVGPRSFEIFGIPVQVPANLASVIDQGLKWKEIGKGIHQALLDVDRETKCELIYMESGAKVPRHTHRGNEAMLMLNGSICDDWDCYSNNDFVLRGQRDSHAQETEEGCICLFVTDDALRFTEGMARFLNPINALWFKFRKMFS
jgi:putative transcriptional regulator